MKNKGVFKRALFCALSAIAAFVTLAATACGNEPAAQTPPQDEQTIPPEEEPTEIPPEEEQSEKTVWDYTVDDLARYLVACGDLDADDYLNMTNIATVSRIYGGVEVLWWDVANLKEGTDACKYWNELEENDFYYFIYTGEYYIPQVNGPFAVRARDEFAGDWEKLRSDFLAFPDGYTEGMGETPRATDYTFDYDRRYSSLEQMSCAYPNASYSYVLNPVPLPEAYCIRDEYVLYTKAQGDAGLCWDFASSTCLTTTIMKATGEYLDFSEAYIAAALKAESDSGNLPNFTENIADNYLYADGGWFVGFDMTAKKSGLLLEQDFPFAESYLVCNENAAEYYANYRQFADYDLMNEVMAVRFDDYAYRSRRSDIVNSMKSHILNDGSIAGWTYTGNFKTGYVDGKAVTYVSPTAENKDEGHIISIIGWDDGFTVTENGVSYTGAWIVLNSWGNNFHDDGIFYIMYDDAALSYGNHFWGYKYLASSDAAFKDRIINSSAQTVTNLCGAYYGDFSAQTAAVKQKNIFYNTSSVDLTYSYELSDGAEIENIQILGGVRAADFNVTLNREERTFRVYSDCARSGLYKVAVTYSCGGKTGRRYNEIYVCDGTEITEISLTAPESGNAVLNNGRFFISNSFGNADATVTYATSRLTGSIKFFMSFTAYGGVCSVTGGSDEVITDAALKNSYAYVTVNYDLTKTDVYSVTVTSEGGASKVVYFKILCADEGETLIANVTCFALGGINPNGDILLLDADGGAYLEAPVREGYTFDGWYYDGAFEKPLREGGLRLASEDIDVPQSAESYYFQMFGEFYGGKSVHVFLYAKWIKN